MTAEEYLVQLVRFLQDFIAGLTLNTARGLTYFAPQGHEVSGGAFGSELVVVTDTRDARTHVSQAKKRWIADLTQGVAEEKGDWTILRWGPRPIPGKALYVEWWHARSQGQTHIDRELYLPSTELISRPRGHDPLYAAVKLHLHPPNFDMETRQEMWSHLYRLYRQTSSGDSAVIPVGGVDVWLFGASADVSIVMSYPMELERWPVDPRAGIDVRDLSAIPPVGNWRVRYAQRREIIIVEIQPAGPGGWATVLRGSVELGGDASLALYRAEGGQRVWRSTVSWANYRGTEMIVAESPYYYVGYPLQLEGRDFAYNVEATPSAIGRGELPSPGIILWWDLDAGTIWLVKV